MDTRETAHYLSIHDAIISDRYKECIRSFTRLHPFFQVKVWSEKDVYFLLSELGLLYQFDKLDNFIAKYNLAKYAILAKHGGWYIDLDIEWKKTIYHLLADRGIKKFPQMFIPVRSFPNQEHINHRFNDDMLLYSDKSLFMELIKFCLNRKEYDTTVPYEPFGPVSLSMWVHSVDYTREYLYEWEIQKNGIYCNHFGSQSWKIN